MAPRVTTDGNGAGSAAVQLRLGDAAELWGAYGAHASSAKPWSREALLGKAQLQEQQLESAAILSSSSGSNDGNGNSAGQDPDGGDGEVGVPIVSAVNDEEEDDDMFKPEDVQSSDSSDSESDNAVYE